MVTTPQQQHCPRCGRALAPTGDLTRGGRVELWIYQCPECVDRFRFAGQTVEEPLSFAIDTFGQRHYTLNERTRGIDLGSI